MQPLSALKARFLGLTGLTATVDPPVPGVYHFQRQEGEEKTRLHLRVDEDGRGFVLVNASRVYHLNPTAVVMAYFTLMRIPADQAVASLQKAFDVSHAQALTDYTQFSTQFPELIRPDGACPIHDLDLETVAPFSARPSAPYRMDLALTYRCNNNCAHCYNARPRHFPELATDQWNRILDR
jgi:hypothetical protein